MKSKKIKKLLIYIISISVGTLFFLFISASTFIGLEVEQECEMAQGQYGGDCVQALTSLVEDEDHDLKKRNQAVWALGQMGDARALSVLNNLYTGEECQHDQFLCQHELKKAIKLCGGGFNITALVWRNNISF